MRKEELNIEKIEKLKVKELKNWSTDSVVDYLNLVVLGRREDLRFEKPSAAKKTNIKKCFKLKMKMIAELKRRGGLVIFDGEDYFYHYCKAAKIPMRKLALV